MIVYIQKKIDKRWRTVLMVDSIYSKSIIRHLRKQYSLNEFRFTSDETDGMQVKLKGLSLAEALDALADISFVDLTWEQGKEVFKELVELMEQIYERYRR